MQTKNLTAKQSRWVHEYLASDSAAASAIKAGFSLRGAGVAGNRIGLLLAAEMGKLPCDHAGMVA